MTVHRQVGTGDSLLETRSANDSSISKHREQTTAQIEIKAGTVVSRYLLIRLLGEGGMGVVYEAFDPDLNRKIALKFLRPTRAATKRSIQVAQERLLAEAQSLAQISHPNVVSIFDVGIYQDSVFIAMEFANGDTLRKWIEHKQPKPNEIIEKLVFAGQGLNSAHKIGIVHQDVKPDNIIVCPDGSVKVLDFGLARHTPNSQDTKNQASHQSSQYKQLDHSSSRLNTNSASTSITTLSTNSQSTASKIKRQIMGTPSYMSPEQHLGEGIDHRSDQFSFCVTMWESLFATRPFQGGDLSQLEQAKRSGAIRFPPTSTRRSKRLIAILQKGMQTDANRRFPTMELLLAEFAQKPLIQRHTHVIFLAIFTTLLLVLAPLATFLGNRTSLASEKCQQGNNAFDKFWNTKTKKQIQQKFAASGFNYAIQTWQHTSNIIDKRQELWEQSFQESCNQIHQKAQGEYLHADLRLSCLEHRKEETRSFVEALQRAEDQTVQSAIQLAQKLSGVEECKENEGLASHFPTPSDKAMSAKVTRLRDQLSNLKVLSSTGEVKDVQQQFLQTIATAKNYGFLPVLAEAHLLYADFLRQSGLAQQSKLQIERSISIAESCNYEQLLMPATANLIYVQGYMLGDSPALAELMSHATAHLHRSGNRSVNRAFILLEAAGAQLVAHEIDNAYQGLEEAIEIYSQLYGRRNFDTIHAIRDFAALNFVKMQFAESELLYREVIASIESLTGPSHPDLFLPLFNLVSLQLDMSRYREAKSTLQKENQLVRESLASNDFVRMQNLVSRIQVMQAFGRVRLALKLSHDSIRLEEQLPGQFQERYQWKRISQAYLHLELGEDEAAQQIVDSLLLKLNESPSQRREQPIDHAIHALATSVALKIGNLTIAENHLRIAQIAASNNILFSQQTNAAFDRLKGIVAQHQGRTEVAIELLTQALDQIKHFFGGDSANITEFYLDLAHSLIMTERFGEAREHIQTARSTVEKTLGDDHPRLSPVWQKLGDLELAQKRVKRALHAWHRAIELFDLENSDPARLLDLCDKYRRQNPPDDLDKCPGL